MLTCAGGGDSDTPRAGAYGGGGQAAAGPSGHGGHRERTHRTGRPRQSRPSRSRARARARWRKQVRPLGPRAAVETVVAAVPTLPKPIE